MTAQEAVQTISNKLETLVKENCSGSEEVLDHLRSLQTQPIDLNVLQSTNIGRTVNSLRKETKNEEVANICRSLVKSWKSLLAPSDGRVATNTAAEPDKKKVKKEDSGTEGSPKDKSMGSLSRSSSSSSFTASPTATPTGKSAAPLKPPPISTKSTSNITTASAAPFASDGDTSTTDEMRLRSRQLLVKALLKDTPPEGAGDPELIAALTETAIFKEFKNTDVKYKNRIRSRIMAVQDSKNPRLRENILLGNIPCARLAVMTSEEMASKEMKELRDKLSKEAINDSQIATSGGTETDLLQCGKCRMRKCTYNQVQTRSADEPMTTFVFCNHCGNRWKFC